MTLKTFIEEQGPRAVLLAAGVGGVVGGFIGALLGLLFAIERMG